MEYFAIYHTPFAPEELTALYPNAAAYSTVTLFVSGALNPSGIVDLKMPFNHPYVEGGAGITAEQLDEKVDRLLAPEPPATRDEVQISIPMVNYLYTTRFKPKIESE
jgi:hypothetical protein